VTRTVDGRTYNLSLTDTAGQEEYRGLWAASNLKSDAFLLVYDITNVDSLANLDYFVQMIEMESDARADAGGAGGMGKKGPTPGSGPVITPVKIVAGNKCDLVGMRQVKSAQGLEYARRHGCGFMETSARNVVNIEETFERV
jgi:GTPase SAR1 family protein